MVLNITELNNEIVKCRGLVKKAKVASIRRKIKQIKVLKAWKKEEEKEKMLQKAERLVQEVLALKKIREDNVTQFALHQRHPEKVLQNTAPDNPKHAYAILAMEKVVKNQIALIQKTATIQEIKKGAKELEKKCQKKAKKKIQAGDSVNSGKNATGNIKACSKKTTEKIKKKKKASSKGGTDEILDRLKISLASDQHSESDQGSSDEEGTLKINSTGVGTESENSEEHESEGETTIKNLSDKSVRNDEGRNKFPKAKRRTQQKLSETTSENDDHSEEDGSEDIEVEKLRKRSKPTNKKVRKPAMKVSSVSDDSSSPEEEMPRAKAEKKVAKLKRQKKSVSFEESDSDSPDEEVEEVKVDDPFFVSKKVVLPKLLLEEKKEDPTKEIKLGKEGGGRTFQKEPRNSFPSGRSRWEGKKSFPDRFSKRDEGPSWKISRRANDHYRQDTYDKGQRNFQSFQSDKFVAKEPNRFDSTRTNNFPSENREENLHPSWAAKRQTQVVQPFQGKKIKFDD